MTADRFEDRLLEQLRRVVAAQPASPRPAARRRAPRGRLILAGAGAAAALAAVAFVVGSGDVATSAYAVESRTDGAVSVSIHSLSDASGLQRSLRAAGVPAVVDYVPAGQGRCLSPPAGGGASDGPRRTKGSSAKPEAVRTREGAGPPAREVAGTRMTVGSDGATFTIDPGDLAPGDEVYITTSTGALSTIGVTVGKDAPPAACAP